MRLAGLMLSERVAGIDALAANDQRILVTQLAFYLLNRGAHRLRIFFFAEISKWFVTKFGWHDWYARLRRAVFLWLIKSHAFCVLSLTV